jgi:hypothetical protein
MPDRASASRPPTGGTAVPAYGPERGLEIADELIGNERERALFRARAAECEEPKR